MRVAYFGLPLGALLLLRDDTELDVCVLSPVEAPGRRRVKRLLGDHVIDARDLPARALESAVDRMLERACPDLIVSWYYTRKLPPRWLEAPLGAIGVHPSLLPRHRGPDPFFWAIDCGDEKTGVTVHRLVEAYDEGDILLQEEVPVGSRNAWQLARALDRPSLRLLRRAVKLFGAGSAPTGVPQDDTVSSYAPAPTGELLRVYFWWSTERVLRRVRALAPVPGVPLEIRGVHVIVTGAIPAQEFPRALVPGEAATVMDGVVIRTGDGAIRLVSGAVEDEATGDVVQVGEREMRALVEAKEGRPALGRLGRTDRGVQ